MPLKDRTRANAVFWHGHWLLLLVLVLLLLVLVLLLLLLHNRRLLNVDRLLGLRSNLLQPRIDNYLLLARKGRVQPRRMLLLLLRSRRRGR